MVCTSRGNQNKKVEGRGVYAVSDEPVVVEANVPVSEQFDVVTDSTYEISQHIMMVHSTTDTTHKSKLLFAKVKLQDEPKLVEVLVDVGSNCNAMGKKWVWL